MKTQILLASIIATLGFGVATAGDHGYKHSHSGSEQARSNGDVSFGQPDDAHHANQKVAWALTSSGKVQASGLGVERNQTVRFDLRNDSAKPVAFVLGDKTAIEEYANLFRSNPDSVLKDFHGVQIDPGQSKQFGWKFSTLNSPTVYAAFIAKDGVVVDRLMKIGVSADRNHN